MSKPHVPILLSLVLQNHGNVRGVLGKTLDTDLKIQRVDFKKFQGEKLKIVL